VRPKDGPNPARRRLVTSLHPPCNIPVGFDKSALPIWTAEGAGVPAQPKGGAKPRVLPAAGPKPLIEPIFRKNQSGSTIHQERMGPPRRWYANPAEGAWIALSSARRRPLTTDLLALDDHGYLLKVGPE